MVQLEKSVRTIIKDCLGLQARESLQIVVEESLSEIGEALWRCAKKTTPLTILSRFSQKYSREPGLPPALEASLCSNDAAIILTPKRISRKLFEAAKQRGCRILVLNHASKELIERLSNVNFDTVANLSRRIADIFTIGRTMHITTPAGTDLKASIAKIKGNAETGFASHNGDFTYLPAGEAGVYLNSNIDGCVAIERIAGQKKALASPIVLHIRNGVIIQIKGGKEAEQLRKDIRKLGQNGRRVSEIGVGTNNKVVFGHSRQEDEKMYGTAHLALGESHATKVHGKIIPAIKGLMMKPPITIDGRLILKEGDFLVGGLGN
jgi:leucyl aminopeptidase (aminopeptidase T)